MSAREVCRDLGIGILTLYRLARRGDLRPVKGIGWTALYLRGDVEDFKATVGETGPLPVVWWPRLAVVAGLALIVITLYGLPAAARITGDWSAGQAKRWAVMEDVTGTVYQTVYSAPAGWRIVGLRVESIGYADSSVYKFGADGKLLGSSYVESFSPRVPGGTLLNNKPYSVALYVNWGWAYVDAVWIAPIIVDKNGKLDEMGRVDLTRTMAVTFTNPASAAEAHPGTTTGPTSAPPAPPAPQPPNPCT